MDNNLNLNNLMKKAQEMQQQMQDAQKRLSEAKISGEAGGPRGIEIERKGNHDATKCNIKDPSLAEDIELLQDLIVAAINDGNRKIEKISKEAISQLTAGLNIPTDFMKDKEDDKE